MPESRTQLERIGDRVPVPQPALDRFLRRRDRRERNRRISAGVVGVLVFAAGLVAFASMTRTGSPPRPADEAPSPAFDVPTFGPRTFEQADLPALILSDDEAPSCTKTYTEDHGKDALFQVEGPEGYRWTRVFFEWAETRAFYDYTPEDDSCGSPHGKVYVRSFAAVFANQEAAARQMSLYISNVVETWDWVDLRRSDPGLSQDGVLLEGNARSQAVLESGNDWDGAKWKPRIYYMWRINNLILHITAEGGYDADEMRSLAELVTSRARHCSTIETGHACR